jgi:dihydrolipoamide dehydrogenase
MASRDYDVLVIGSGPGGYVAAIRAAQLGLKAAVVERDKVGGVCLNVGCIPSKSLIHQAELVRAIPELEALGVKIDRSGLEYAKAYAKSRKAADTLSRGVQFLLKKNGIELIRGEAALEGPNEVAVDGRTLGAGAIVVATGSRPREIPGFPFDGKAVLSSTDALMLQRLPRRVLVLGGGAIGVEFAHILSSFGVEVHLVEMMDRLLPLEDADSVAVLTAALRRRGVSIATSTKAIGMQTLAAGARVTLEDRTGARAAVEADQVLVVVGRTPNTEGLGLERLGIALERGFIPVGDGYRTRVPSVYAIGDVVGGTPLLAHVASKEGEIAAEHIAGRPGSARIDALSIPSGVYSEPQLASFGLTEEKAAAAGRAYQKAVFPYRGAGKSVAVEQTEGQVKLLVDPANREIIGAHVVGAEATELIHELLLARIAELLPADVADMVHAHPTLSEAIMEAARLAEGRVINV